MNNSILSFKGGWNQLQHAKLKHMTPLLVSQPQGIDWSIDGEFLTVVDNDSSTTEIVEYTADGDPYDSSLISKTAFTYNSSIHDTTCNEIRWSRDGMHLYFFGGTTMTIFQLNAVTPFRLDGMGYTGVFFAPPEITTNIGGGFIMGDEKRFYIVVRISSVDTFFSYDMPSKGDLAGSALVHGPEPFESENLSIRSIVIHPDETQMFLLQDSGSDEFVYRRVFGIKGDLASTRPVDSLDVGIDITSDELLPRAMTIRQTDGKKLYIAGIVKDSIAEYDMSLSENDSEINELGDEIINDLGENLVYV